MARNDDGHGYRLAISLLWRSRYVCFTLLLFFSVFHLRSNFGGPAEDLKGTRRPGEEGAHQPVLGHLSSGSLLVQTRARTQPPALPLPDGVDGELDSTWEPIDDRGDEAATTTTAARIAATTMTPTDSVTTTTTTTPGSHPSTPSVSVPATPATPATPADPTALPPYIVHGFEAYLGVPVLPAGVDRSSAASLPVPLPRKRPRLSAVDPNSAVWEVLNVGVRRREQQGAGPADRAMHTRRTTPGSPRKAGGGLRKEHGDRHHPGNNNHTTPAASAPPAASPRPPQTQTLREPPALSPWTRWYDWNDHGAPSNAPVLLQYKAAVGGAFRAPHDGLYAIRLSALTLADGGRAVVRVDGNDRLELPVLWGVLNAAAAAPRKGDTANVQARRAVALNALEGRARRGELSMLVGYVVLAAGDHVLTVQAVSRRLHSTGQSGGLFHGLSMAVSHCTVTPVQADRDELSRGWVRPPPPPSSPVRRSVGGVGGGGSGTGSAVSSSVGAAGGAVTALTSDVGSDDDEHDEPWWPARENGDASAEARAAAGTAHATHPTHWSVDYEQCRQPTTTASDMAPDVIDQTSAEHDCTSRGGGDARGRTRLPPLAHFDRTTRELHGLVDNCNGTLRLIVDDPVNSQELMSLGDLTERIPAAAATAAAAAAVASVTTPSASGTTRAGRRSKRVVVPRQLESFAVDCQNEDTPSAAADAPDGGVSTSTPLRWRREGYPDFFLELQRREDVAEAAHRLASMVPGREGREEGSAAQDQAPAGGREKTGKGGGAGGEKEDAIDVLVIWIDSLSRASFYQLLPRTAQLLSDYAVHGQEIERETATEKSTVAEKEGEGKDAKEKGAPIKTGPKVRAFDYRLYNALAGATQMNFPPMFCGKMANQCPQDGSEWLSETFRRHGYVRSFAESDMCPLGHNSLSRLLLYEMAGHPRQLSETTRRRILEFTSDKFVDHSSNNWVCSVSPEIGDTNFKELDVAWTRSSDRLCFGGRNMFEWSMEYVCVEI